MIHRVPYKQIPLDSNPFIHSVSLQIQLSLATTSFPRTPFFEVIIDSGASRCLFSGQVAKLLGLNLEAGRLVETDGIGRRLQVWIHDVTLHIAGESVIVPAGFAPHMTSSGLLGLTGFFSNFDVTFDSRLRECRFERTGGIANTIIL